MLLVVGFCAGLAVTALALVGSRRARVLAIPDQRSSHSRPTPTLGGIGIVVPMLVFCAWLLIGGEERPLATAILAAGGSVALLGFFDDLYTLSPWIRLPIQVLATALAISILPLPALQFPPFAVVEPWLVLSITGFLLLWLVNLYNFMDGIDGLAAGQCITFCVGVIWLGATGSMAELCWLLTGISVGFVVLNWSPAKIFMGDIGSGFVGLLLGLAALTLAVEGTIPFVASMLLLTGFWFDATYTLCARIVTGQRIFAPHRSHFYQKCARRYGHGRTTMGSLVLNLLWLTPLAMLAQLHVAWSALWVAVAMSPYLAGCIALRAGMPEPDSANTSASPPT